MYLNQVELIGFLGNDAEVRFTPHGNAVTSLSLATTSSWKDGDEWKERTEWHRIQVWGKLGEYAKDFRKGAHIRVVGEIRSRDYVAKDGTRVQTYDVVAESILNLRTGQRVAPEQSDAADTTPAEEASAKGAAASPKARRGGKGRA